MYIYINIVLYVYIYTQKIINIQINGKGLTNNNSYKQLFILSTGQMSYFGGGKKKKMSNYYMFTYIRMKSLSFY